MTPEEKYIFDLKGYLVIRQALTKDLVKSLNEEIDFMETLTNEEVMVRGVIRQYNNKNENYDVSRHNYSCNPLPMGGSFEKVIDCPSTLPYIRAMISEPVRLDAYSFFSRKQGQCSALHHGYAELLAYSEFAIEDEQFKCVSVKVAYALTDVSEKEGSFVVIPGSHKSNFDNPFSGSVPDENHPLIETCPCKAGDAVLFSEDLTHGALINQSNKTRRTFFISYAPAFQTPWGKLVDTAEGFKERATPGQLELIKGPSPFAIAES